MSDASNIIEDIKKKLGGSKWALVLKYFYIPLTFAITCAICFLFQLLSPSKLNLKNSCISGLLTGMSNKFDFDVSKPSYGGLPITSNIYLSAGQYSEWTDTGFVTNGQRLEIVASGGWFPWGRAITPSEPLYETIYTRDTSTGALLASKAEAGKSYVECPMNTDVEYDATITDQTKILESLNFTNLYTDKNSKNVNYDSKVKKSDCIIGYNCYLNGLSDATFTPCRLSNGRGLYIKIGDNVQYAYHIANHFAPSIYQYCLANFSSSGSGQSCEYKYSVDDKKKLKMTTIPFSLPMLVKTTKQQTSNIIDVRTIHDPSIVDIITAINDYKYETDYLFTTYASSSNCVVCSSSNNYTNCNPNCEIVNGANYEVVEKKMTPNNYPVCPTNYSKQPLAHPSELCPPTANQKIYIKAADTVYSDNDGVVTLIFNSGAIQKTTTLSNLNFQFLINLFQAIVSPLWGSQNSFDDIDSLVTITVDNTSQSIDIKTKSSSSNVVLTPSVDPITNNLKVTLSPNTDNGIVFYYDTSATVAVPGAVRGDTISQVQRDSNNYLNVTYPYGRTNTSFVSVKSNSSADINKATYDYYTSNTANLIDISNFQEGLIFKFRDGILKSATFQTLKIVLVVMFVFNYGLNIMNTKSIVFQTVQYDLIFILIILWATDLNNYQFFDDIILKLLFKVFLSFGTLLMSAANDVYGTSIDTSNILSYFQGILQSVLSTETFLRLYSVMISEYGMLIWFTIYPVITTIIRFASAVIKPTMFCILTTSMLSMMIILFPLFAVMSLMPEKKALIYKWFDKMKAEFLNLSVTLGFFGLFVGFPLYFFRKAIGFDICWKSLVDITIIPYLWEINFSTWRAADFNPLSYLLYLLLFYISINFTTKGIEWAGKLANDIAGSSGGLGMNMGNASKVGNLVQGITTGIAGSMFNGLKKLMAPKAPRVGKPGFFPNNPYGSGGFFPPNVDRPGSGGFPNNPYGSGGFFPPNVDRPGSGGFPNNPYGSGGSGGFPNNPYGSGGSGGFPGGSPLLPPPKMPTLLDRSPDDQRANAIIDQINANMLRDHNQLVDQNAKINEGIINNLKNDMKNNKNNTNYNNNVNNVNNKNDAIPNKLKVPDLNFTKMHQQIYKEANRAREQAKEIEKRMRYLREEIERAAMNGDEDRVAALQGRLGVQESLYEKSKINFNDIKKEADTKWKNYKDIATETLARMNNVPGLDKAGLETELEKIGSIEKMQEVKIEAGPGSTDANPQQENQQAASSAEQKIAERKEQEEQKEQMEEKMDLIKDIKNAKNNGGNE